MLATCIAVYNDELRADLQQTYNISLDDAMRGLYSVAHISALVSQLPHDARIYRRINPDSVWGVQETVLAIIANSLNALIYGLSDKRSRGRRPELIGPSWMREKQRQLPARVLSIDELMRELSKPREEGKNG